MKYFNNKDPILRRLLLHYKYRNYTIEEAVSFINNSTTISDKYLSDEVFKEHIIPILLNKFLSKNDRINWYHYKRRDRNLVQLQQILMYLMKEENFGGKRSNSKIGALIRNKDHSTVLHACKTVKNLVNVDKDFKSYFNKIKQFLILKL